MSSEVCLLLTPLPDVIYTNTREAPVVHDVHTVSIAIIINTLIYSLVVVGVME